MDLKDLSDEQQQAMYRAYKAFATDFQQQADHLIHHDAEQTVATPDPIEVVFDVDAAVDDHDYVMKMAALGRDTATAFAHARGRQLTSVAWPAIDLLPVEDRKVVVRIPLTNEPT